MEAIDEVAPPLYIESMILPTQVKELSARAEFLRSEREKALKLLQAEQQQSASLRQSVDALQSQV